MRDIQDFPNVDAPDADYPTGNVKDNTGGNNGTPVNKLTMSDMWQFFNRLMTVASVVANGLPENVTNGFQLITALTTYINSLITTAVNAEAVIRSAADVVLANDISALDVRVDTLEAQYMRTGSANSLFATDFNTATTAGSYSLTQAIVGNDWSNKPGSIPDGRYQLTVSVGGGVTTQVLTGATALKLYSRVNDGSWSAWQTLI